MAALARSGRVGEKSTSAEFGLGLAAWYGLANLAYFLGYSAFNTYVLFFYTEHLHAPAHLIGRAWLLFGLWNTLNDLVCGWISDRVPARWGRRSLPILLLAGPVGLAFLLVWNPPDLVTRAGGSVLVGYFLLCVSLYDVLQTAVNISQGAAFPEITFGLRQRSRVASIRQVMGIAGSALGVAVSPLLYGRLGWGRMGLVWGALIGGLYLLSLRGFRQARLEEPGRPDARSWLGELRDVFGQTTFQTFLGVQLSTRFALAFIQAALPFYAAHVLRFSPDRLAMVLGVMLVSAALAMPLGPWLLARLGLRRAGLLAAGALGALMLPFLFVRGPSALLLLGLTIGPVYGILTVVLDLLYARVVDLDAARTGRSRAGLLAGATGTALRLAPALAGLLLGELLVAAGYAPGTTAQPEAVGTALRLLMVGLPGFALGSAACCLARFPDGEPRR